MISGILCRFDVQHRCYFVEIIEIKYLFRNVILLIAKSAKCKIAFSSTLLKQFHLATCILRNLNTSLMKELHGYSKTRQLFKATVSSSEKKSHLCMTNAVV